jgi:hypothetical protein
MRHVEEGSVRPTPPTVDYWLLSYGDRWIWTPISTSESGVLVTGNVDPCTGYGQFWGMRSGSGLVLGSDGGLAVAKADTTNDLGEAL